MPTGSEITATHELTTDGGQILISWALLHSNAELKFYQRYMCQSALCEKAICSYASIPTSSLYLPEESNIQQALTLIHNILSIRELSILTEKNRR